MASRRGSSCEHRLAWLIMQPFGAPVVPDVNAATASSSVGRTHSPLAVATSLPGSHQSTMSGPLAQAGRSP
jgi:hypothetical protein